MKSMYARTTVAALALLLSAGCADSLIAPAASIHPSDIARSVSDAGIPSFLHANSARYADLGSRPSTGHTGVASIMSRALLAKDGSTLVEATTGVLDAGASAGTIAKVQAELVHAADTSVANYNKLASGGAWSHTYAGLARNDLVLLHSNVRDIDLTRTDVVFTRDTVKLRPDLQVGGLVVASRAWVNTAVPISATVAEVNHDVGARATCVLRVDGVPAEQASGIWVDAGDAVTCAFRHTFTSVGTHDLSVTATNVVPADWDMANNSVAGTIAIVTPEVRLSWYMTFSGSNSQSVQTSNDPWSGNASYASADSSRSVDVSAWSTDATPFGSDMTFSATLTSDGAVIGRASAPATQADICRYGFDATHNTSFAACQYGSSDTELNAHSYSTRSVYYGNYYFGYDYNGYSYGDNSHAGFGAFPIGQTVGLDVKLSDASGTSWRAEALTPVQAQPFHTSWNNVYSSGTSSGSTFFGRNSGQ